ncbi:transposable element Tcb1 transposase [Trichonephila clavipes]|nr:transposable element Tcb1 transposase [Trichonephila clavipes]
METIPIHTDSCPKARRRSPKGYNPRGRLKYCYCSQVESQSDLHSVTFMVIASIGKAISAVTVRRRLHMNGLCVRVPRVCIPLSVQSRGARLKWCREHGNLTVSDWGNVMFTDESRFALEPDDKCIRIWRKQGTRNQPQNITEHHAFRGGSIMVWAGISLGYRTDLHIFKRCSMMAVRYRDDVLELIVRFYAAAVGPTFVLMDDNARSLNFAYR